MNHGSLFSGIGGFDLAAEWMGWENLFHCEWDPFCQKILKYYWPNAKSYGDITKTDFTIWRGRIDVLTGGFPCQPYSQAGKRLGKEDARHLWPEMLRAIREIAPTYVVGENVYGLINWNGGLVFDEVQTDLEAEGYEVLPVILPAAGVNAPHRRDRVWFVAYRNNDGFNGCDGQYEIHTDKRGEHAQHDTIHNESTRATPDSRSQQFQERASERNPQDTEKEGAGMDNRTERPGYLGDVTDPKKQRLERSHTKGRTRSSGFDSKPDWQGFPTQSPICSGDDGLPSQLDGITFPKWRNESIKGYGNAIVPKVAYQIFKIINELNKKT